VPEGVVESSPAGYRLALVPDAVDALSFEAQARAGRQALARGDAPAAASLLRAALSRWRGPALADVAHEEFAVAPAARLSELRSAAAVDRIEADLTLGSADASLIGELRQLTAADPLAERPAALLMRALAAAGRQADALTVYQRVRDQLAEQLGVSPSPQLEQAYLAVLRQEVPPAGYGTTVAEAAPAPQAAELYPAAPSARRAPTSFIGRDDDVAAVLKRVASERLVTLTGSGGVGKTRLSAEAAARLTAPVWLTELAPVSDPAEVPYAVLDALGLRERSIARRGSDSAGDPVGQLCAALADRDAVLVLDNCEHLIDAVAGLAARLLSDCPRVRLLATSREPLRIPGEVLHVVTPLAAPPPPAAPAAGGGLTPVGSAGTHPEGPMAIPELAAYPAVRMFADRAVAVIPGFQLEPGNADAVARICRSLDGMPLAIELAAPWLRTLTSAQLADRLASRFDLLTGGSRTALPRHQTLRAAVAWSWDLLSEPEQVLARRLAVFPGGATLTAAESVAAQAGAAGDSARPGRPALPGQDVLPVLAGLVAKSIVSRADAAEDGESRYRMLETVRAYGLERLSEADEEARTRDAFARYYLDLAETADPQLRTREQARWFRTLSAEQDNMNAAIRWVIASGDAATGLRLVRSLGYYWVQRGHGEADSFAREVLALPVPPLTRKLAEARVICALLAAGWSWDIDRIREPLTDALTALEQFGSDPSSVHPLVAQAEPLLMQYDGAADQAVRQFERYGELQDPWLRAIAQVYLCATQQTLGNLDGAEEHCRAGLAELRAIGEQWGVAVALIQLAEFTELRADHAASVAALTEAVAIGRVLGVWGDLSYVQARLALLYARSGEPDRARAEFARVEQLARARGAGVDTDRWVSFMRAELAWRDGDYQQAASWCEAVLAVIAPNQARWWYSLRAQVKVRLGLAVAMQGDLPRCRELLSEALDAAAAWCEHPALATVLDACAAYVLARNGHAGAGRAAWLLGASHAVRGAFDESSLDAPQVRDSARQALGPAEFAAAYAGASGSSYDSAIAGAREALAG
jgi:predicted ATPase